MRSSIAEKHENVCQLVWIWDHISMEIFAAAMREKLNKQKMLMTITFFVALFMAYLLYAMNTSLDELHAKQLSKIKENYRLQQRIMELEEGIIHGDKKEEEEKQQTSQEGKIEIRIINDCEEDEGERQEDNNEQSIEY